MVRLEVPRIAFPEITGTFQFQHGTIGSISLISFFISKPSFNSNMVRLEAENGDVDTKTVEFQFQHGTIGSLKIHSQ